MQKISIVLLAAASCTPKLEPCQKLENACREAGYETGLHAKKSGLVLDCLKPILRGSIPPAVKVADADVKACNETRKKPANPLP